MRELDIKVWEIAENRFVDWYGIYRNLVHVAIGDQYFLNNNLSGLQEKDEFILCFFTGQTDKNGKKIYQGDVFILGDHNIRYVVELIDGAYMGRRILDNILVGLGDYKDVIQIVGNMQENPNLCVK